MTDVNGVKRGKKNLYVLHRQIGSHWGVGDPLETRKREGESRWSGVVETRGTDTSGKSVGVYGGSKTGRQCDSTRDRPGGR